MKERMIKKVIKKMATSLVTNVPYEWPPGCLFMIYQPVRPEQKNVQSENSGTCEKKEEQ